METTMGKNITSIERHIASKDMYDDNGYCDTKIKKYETYYIRICDDGGDVHCSKCLAQMLIEYRETDHDYEFRDYWAEDFELIKGAK
jgi:hypothetical protein